MWFVNLPARNKVSVLGDSITWFTNFYAKIYFFCYNIHAVFNFFQKNNLASYFDTFKALIINSLIQNIEM